MRRKVSGFAQDYAHGAGVQPEGTGNDIERLTQIRAREA